jgi:hypothetical protein
MALDNTSTFVSGSFQKGDPILMSDQGVQVGKTVLQIPCDLKDFEQILGSPDRKFVGEFDIHIWDKLGIFVYCFTDDEVVITLSVALGECEYRFWPKNRMAGKLMIDELEITEMSGTAVLLKADLQQSEIIDTYWEKEFEVNVINAGTDDDFKRILSVDFTFTFNMNSDSLG